MNSVSCDSEASVEEQPYLRSFPSNIGGGRSGGAGRGTEEGQAVTVKMILEMTLRCHKENGPLAGTQGSFALPFPLSPSRRKALAVLSPPPASEQCTGTLQSSQELNQKYISFTVSQTSKTVHSHWFLEAQGSHGGLIIIILYIHRLLFSKEHSCTSPNY